MPEGRDAGVARKQMGLQLGFSQQDLRKAYLRGCRKLAPDKGGDAESFDKLQRAYTTLLPLAMRPEIAVDMASARASRGDASGSTSAAHHGIGNGHERIAGHAKKFKTANEAYEAIHGDASKRMRGHQDYLRRDVRPELRAPDKIPEARLHETFDRVAAKRSETPWTVSTHVVKPLEADTSVGHPIHDDDDDYGDGVWLTDLQRAYGPA